LGHELAQAAVLAVTELRGEILRHSA
jgi:hypothetical protein